uniref:G_PROTEIN_RECEP_F1_2 domain-containing protein n=1 Tax=Bursaphelenchus xylophilus TaxID=6326 RepID=A0A1I7S043_BURXY
MFTLGVYHLSSLMTTGIFSAFFYIRGAVFCSYPSFVFISGAFDLASWCAGSTTNILITVNRCVMMYNTNLNNILFNSKTIYIWILLIELYHLGVLFFVQPPLFNSLEMTYVVNPHSGYYADTDGIYHIVWASVHNCTDFAVSIVAVSTFLIVYHRKKNRLAEKNAVFDRQG